MWVSPFPRCQFSRHIPGPTLSNFHFSIFSVFLTIFQFIQCLCLNFHFFKFSRQNPSTTACISQYFTYSTIFRDISAPTVGASHIKYFSMIFAIIHVVACEFLILLVCHFSRHIPGPTMWVFHFFVGEFYRLFTGPTVGISHFSRLSVFLAIFQVIQCLSLIFHVFQCSHQHPCPTVFIYHI